MSKAPPRLRGPWERYMMSIVDNNSSAISLREVAILAICASSGQRDDCDISSPLRPDRCPEIDYGSSVSEVSPIVKRWTVREKFAHEVYKPDDNRPVRWRKGICCQKCWWKLSRWNYIESKYKGIRGRLQENHSLQKGVRENTPLAFLLVTGRPRIDLQYEQTVESVPLKRAVKK